MAQTQLPSAQNNGANKNFSSSSEYLVRGAFGAIKHEQVCLRHGINPWRHWGTPLEDYTPGVGNMMPLLELRAADAKRQNQKLQMMDVGMGPGRQWKPFYEKYKDDLDFWATTFDDSYVWEPLRSMTRQCRASLLKECFHEPHFQESFDIIISSMGVTYDECACLVSIAKLLKVGGEALLHFEIHSGKIEQFEKILGLTGLKKMNEPDFPNFPGFRTGGYYSPATYFIMKTNPFEESFCKILESLDPFALIMPPPSLNPDD